MIAWQLAEVQRIGHVGTWEFRPGPERIVWSAETCRIMGLGQRSFDGSVATLLSLVHPDGRDVVQAMMREGRKPPRPSRLEYRVGRTVR